MSFDSNTALCSCISWILTTLYYCGLVMQSIFLSVSIIGKVFFPHLLIVASPWLSLVAVDVPWKFCDFAQEIFHIRRSRNRNARSPL